MGNEYFLALIFAAPFLIPVIVYFGRIAWLRAEMRFFKPDERENDVKPKQ